MDSYYYYGVTVGNKLYLPATMENILKDIVLAKKIELIDLNVIVPNKVVEATFSDETKEKVVLQEPDVFSLETAITILMCKKLLGGTKEYNNMVKRVLKDYDNKLKKKQEEKEEEERIYRKREKRKAYKAKREERRLNAEKERQIEIQKEAYIRAMKELNK